MKTPRCRVGRPRVLGKRFGAKKLGTKFQFQSFPKEMTTGNTRTWLHCKPKSKKLKPAWHSPLLIDGKPCWSTVLLNATQYSKGSSVSTVRCRDCNNSASYSTWQFLQRFQRCSICCSPPQLSTQMCQSSSANFEFEALSPFEHIFHSTYVELFDIYLFISKFGHLLQFAVIVKSRQHVARNA